MPRQKVELERWQVAAAFAVIVVIAVLIAIWNDQRIDAAEERITRNAARAADLQETNRRQDQIRAALLEGLRHADFRACERIEELKRQNRIEAQRNFRMLARNLRLLGLEPSPAIVQAAAEGLARDLRRNAARVCPRT